MQLARSTDIALRVLMLVGAQDERATVSRLATTLAVPPNHMAKIVQRLQHHGLVVTTRGRLGGVQLDADAAVVTLGGIVRLLEGDGELIDCDDPPCPLRTDCRLRTELWRARQAFLHSLDGTRLGELIASPASAVLIELHTGSV